jgi:SAM-dependent methyltransferase
MAPVKDPTLRFSSRVQNYTNYRPRYPQEVIGALKEECGLTPASLIADIGSGTGFLAELFLQNGNPVFAIEPNREMREAGERILEHYPNLRSLEGKAEATGLPGHSVDFVVAGQSFHWFDRRQAFREFQRILKPAGWVMVVWNDREIDATPFMRAYDQLLRRFSIDYARETHKRAYDSLADFYGPQGLTLKTFPHRQKLAYAGLQGRLLSSSYTPETGHPNSGPMLAELSQIFQAHRAEGQVTMEYITRMYYGRLS